MALVKGPWKQPDTSAETARPQPILTEGDLPLGPYAGWSFDIWATRAGKKHVSRDCPYLKRSSPHKEGTVTLPEKGTLADLRLLMPQCDRCLPVLPDQQYLQLAGILLNHARSLTEIGDKLGHERELYTYAQFLDIAKDYADGGQLSGRQAKQLQPARAVITAEIERLARKHRATHTSDGSRHELYLIMAATLLADDIERRRPGHLLNEFLGLARDEINEIDTDGLSTRQYSAVKNALLDMAEGWLERLSGGPYGTPAGWGKARERLSDQIKRLAPEHAEALGDKLHAMWTAYLTGVAAAGTGHRARTPMKYLVAHDGGWGVIGPHWTRDLTYELHPSATRVVDGCVHHIAVLPRLMVDAVMQTAPADRSATVIAPSGWPDDEKVCQYLIGAVPKAAFQGGERWWSNIDTAAWERMLARSRTKRRRDRVL